MTAPDQQIPQAFIWRRLHSLAGIWLAVFVFLHLLTNSQAALFFGDDGIGFIRSVNSIHDLPYLPIIEILILAVPILVHLLWGLHYLATAKYNSFGSSSGREPHLPSYPRNHAYTWQRVTAWLLIVGVIAHVVHMRFIEYPMTAFQGAQTEYLVRISDDAGLSSLAKRLDVHLYGSTEQMPPHWVQQIEREPLKEGQVIAVADNFGTVELLTVRDTFKSPVMIALYTLLVLATCYHAFNGLWTFAISWGVTLSQQSQRWMRHLSTLLMVTVSALGLAAIWLTYWINLKQ